MKSLVFAAVFVLGLFPMAAGAQTADVLSAKATQALQQVLQEAQVAGQYRPEPKLDDAAPWQNLFNGKDLSGWRTVNGGKGHVAKFEAKDGCIVGTNVKGCGWNSFLRTDKGYSDFVFTCDFRWEVPGNSGVQIRSHQMPWGQGTEDGRVWGYQVEMDEKARAWTGGLQEEGSMRPARGWLHNLKGKHFDAARAAVKLKEWNRMTVRAIGPRIETWINGVPCTDYVEKRVTPKTKTGFFALQVHFGPILSRIDWRHLKVLPLGPVGDEPVPAPKKKK